MALSIQERIKDLRIEHKLTLEQLAEQTGLSKSALGNYENDEFKDISHYALIKLADFYNVSVDYLLGRMETKNHSNTAIDELHLNDVMIELLKNKKIDSPLLCELASHPDFVKLLADIKIYVEGIATMQIQNLNIWVDYAREEIIKNYNPDKNDPTLHTLESAHIDENEYSTQRIHNDMDSIMKDLRKVHLGRNDSAPKTSVTEELKRDMDEILNFKGNRVEQLLFAFCKQTKIKYHKLSEEEKKWLIQIVQKSEFSKSHIPQRGKK